MKTVLKNSRETNRWLKALEIARVVFWHEGYHQKFLLEIESFIRSQRMCSPKIVPELIPELYKVAKKRKIPMTKLVNRIIEEYLKNLEKNQDPKRNGD